MRAPGRKGQKGTEWEKQTQPPNTGLMSQRSRRTGDVRPPGLVRKEPAGLAPACGCALSLTLPTGKPAPCAPQASAQGRRRAPRATSASGTRPGVPFAGALWVRPGWGAPLWVRRAGPGLAGQAALAPRQVAGWVGELHLGGLHAAT